ncbi:MAG: FG-GAP-like repeat-containing protein [Nocardioides sp.]
MPRPLALLTAAGLSAALLAAPAAPSLASGSPRAHGSGVRGDFDGDGRVDLAIGAPGGNRVMIRYTHASPGGSHVAWIAPVAHSHHYQPDFGRSLAVGDFNGDGFADLAVGAPSYTTPPTGGGVLETRGAVFVFHGSPHGLVADPLAITGPYDGGDPFELGGALAAADVNHDGKDDLAVTLGGADNGNIRVYHGSASGLGTTFQALDDYEATSLAFGDLNRDHHPELVAGSTIDLANPTDEFSGDVMVWHGTSSGLRASNPQKIRGDQLGLFSDLGYAVATGDVNGDGYTDVVAGAPYDRYVGTRRSAGTIVLLTGGPHGLKARHHQRLNEKRLNPHWHDGNGFGSALSVTHVDGDRFGDVVVGAVRERVSGKSRAGAVYLVHGGRHGLTAHHAQRITQASRGIPGNVAHKAAFGTSVWGVKLDRDRFGDVVIGVPDTAGSSRGGGFARIPGSRTGLKVAAAFGVFSHRHGFRLGASVR